MNKAKISENLRKIKATNSLFFQTDGISGFSCIIIEL